MTLRGQCCSIWDKVLPGINGGGEGSEKTIRRIIQSTLGGDILSFDIYPVTHGNPEVQGKLEYVARGVGRLKNLVSPQQRVWNIIGVSRISNPLVKPTPDQVRSQVWMSIIHGSQGIIYFVHQFKPDFIEASLLHDMEIQQEVKRLNRRIIDLAPLLNSPNG